MCWYCPGEDKDTLLETLGPPRSSEGQEVGVELGACGLLLHTCKLHNPCVAGTHATQTHTHTLLWQMVPAISKTMRQEHFFIQSLLESS